MSHFAGMHWDEFLDRLDPTYVVADVEHDARIETRIPGNGASLGTSLAGYDKITRRPIAHYFPFRHIDVNVPIATGEKLRTFIKSVGHLIYFNAKNDLVTLKDLGISTDGKFYDVMLMEHWINGKWTKMSLDVISKLHGGEPKAMPEDMYKIVHVYKGKNGGWQDVPYFMMREYSCQDAIITLNLFRKLHPKFARFEELWEIEQTFIRDVIIPMERVGIRLDKKFCEKEREYGLERMEEIKVELGLNPSSPKDMHELFINKLNLGVKRKTPKGAPSFDKVAIEMYEADLERLNSPVARMIREFKGWQKTISSSYELFLSHMQRDGRIRTNFHLHRTFTGRLSADYSMHQLPRLSDKEWNGNLRNGFIGAPGYTLWDADYSQLELRIIAHYADDTELIELLNDPSRNIFKEMSKRLGWEYTPTKVFVYSVSYGAGVQRIMEIFGVSVEHAKYLRDQFFDEYSKIHKLLQRCKNTYTSKGYIKLWTGREIRNRVENKPYAALDYVAQGGGAEIVKRNMIELAHTIDWLDCRMVLTVHDDIVFEIRNGTEDYWLPIIKEIMERPPHSSFKTKFPVSIKRWGTEEEYEFTQ